MSLSLPQPTRDPAQILSDLRKTGIAFHQNFLSPEQTAALRERVLEQAELEIEQGVAETSATGTASETRFTGPEAPNPPFQLVSFLPNKGRVFLDLLQDQRLLEYCGEVFHGAPFFVANQAATIVRKGAAGQVIHTDQQAWPFLTPLPIMFNCVLALSDFTPENGSTCFVPATHNGPPPRIGIDETTGLVGNLDSFEVAAPTLKAGDMALWDARVWHGQGASVSDVTRIAVITTYVMHMVRPQDIYSALLHDDVVASLSPRERSLLGFDVHFGYAGRIAPRNPEDSRSNSNFAYPYVPELRRGGAKRAVPRGDMRIGHTETQAEIVA